MNKVNNLLEFKGLEKKFLEVVQYGEVPFHEKNKREIEEYINVEKYDDNSNRKAYTEAKTHHDEKIEEKKMS